MNTKQDLENINFIISFLNMKGYKHKDINKSKEKLENYIKNGYNAYVELKMKDKVFDEKIEVIVSTDQIIEKYLMYQNNCDDLIIIDIHNIDTLDKININKCIFKNCKNKYKKNIKIGKYEYTIGKININYKTTLCMLITKRLSN